MALTTATRDGIDRITLQLEPADLGRVEIKMDIAADGRTQLSFVVDKAETLDALSRDARSLERSLQESGIKADAGSMQFNLRQQPQPQFSDMGGDASDNGPGQQAANDNSAVAPVASTSDGITKHYTINVRDGVDIHA
jgi:flagellar hook-length control protein FliK